MPRSTHTRRLTLAAWAIVTLASMGLGCAEPPRDAPALDVDPWRVRTEVELQQAIADARREAQASGRRVLLDFVADWCTDCREVVRVSQLEPARTVLAEHYVVLYVEVGRFDRHRALLREHGIDRIATLVVLDPSTGQRVAKTTLEPITTGQALTPEALASWLRQWT